MRFLTFVLALGAAILASPAAQAACSWTSLTNGTTANATQVMNNFDCLAPLDNPSLTGTLTLNGGSGHAIAILNRPDSSHDAGIVFQGAGSSLWLLGIDPAFGSSGDLAFYSTATSSVSMLMQRSSGNVGIGTTAPAAVLDIYGAGASYQLQLANPTASAYTQMRYAGTGRAWQTGVGNASEATFGVANKFYLFDSTASAMRIAVDSSGNMGVGTTAPGAKLDVSGMIRQSACTTAGTLSANTSGDIICTSDARLKNVLGAYTNGLAAILRISPQRFRYKPTPANPVEKFTHAGFIAQDVKAAIPEASALQRDGYYSLDTTAILAASVSAIKELHAANRELEQTVRSQAAELREMKRRLGSLERARMQTASR